MVNQRTMNAARFEAICRSLGFSKRGAAHFFGVSERTVRRWIEEDHVPRPVAMVLSLMEAHQIGPEAVLNTAKVRESQKAFVLANLYGDWLVAPGRPAA